MRQEQAPAAFYLSFSQQMHGIFPVLFMNINNLLLLSAQKTDTVSPGSHGGIHNFYVAVDAVRKEQFPASIDFLLIISYQQFSAIKNMHHRCHLSQ
jgi:hypothetical protein